VVSAPLFYLAELAAAERFLYAWNGDRRLDIDAYANGLPDPGEPLFPFTGPYRDYFTIEAGVDLAAAHQVLQAVQQPGHQYHAVWQAYSQIQPEFAATDYLTRGFKRPDSPAGDFTATLQRMGEDTTLPFIMETALQANHDKGWGGQRLTNYLMEHSEELSWASTLSRRTRLSAFPAAGERSGTSPDRPFVLGKTRQILIESLGHLTFWARPDIQDGPREASSFCPMSSNVDLSATNAGQLEVVEGIYAVQASFAWHRRMTRIEGDGNGAEMHIIRSIPLMAETILPTI